MCQIIVTGNGNDKASFTPAFPNARTKTQGASDASLTELTQTQRSVSQCGVEG